MGYLPHSFWIYPNLGCLSLVYYHMWNGASQRILLLRSGHSFRHSFWFPVVMVTENWNHYEKYNDLTIKSRYGLLKLDSLFHVTDPFKEPEAAEDGGTHTNDCVHIHIQQRNGRKCVTTIEGLGKDYNYKKFLKDMKKDFCCNGNLVQDLERGQVLHIFCSTIQFN